MFAWKKTGQVVVVGGGGCGGCGDRMKKATFQLAGLAARQQRWFTVGGSSISNLSQLAPSWNHHHSTTSSCRPTMIPTLCSSNNAVPTIVGSNEVFQKTSSSSVLASSSYWKNHHHLNGLLPNEKESGSDWLQSPLVPSSLSNCDSKLLNNSIGSSVDVFTELQADWLNHLGGASRNNGHATATSTATAMASRQTALAQKDNVERFLWSNLGKSLQKQSMVVEEKEEDEEQKYQEGNNKNRKWLDVVAANSNEAVIHDSDDTSRIASRNYDGEEDDSTFLTTVSCPSPSSSSVFQITEVYQMLGRNNRKPKRANHGKRPCSRWARRKKRSQYGRFRR